MRKTRAREWRDLTPGNLLLSIRKIMRTQLSPFIDQFVLVTGRLDDQREADENITRFISEIYPNEKYYEMCVKNARVSLYSLDKTLVENNAEHEENAVKVDHLWVRVPCEKSDIERLSKLWFPGLCMEYTRSNGTEDIGIEWMPAVAAGKYKKAILKHIHAKAYGPALDMVAHMIPPKGLRKEQLPLNGLLVCSDASHNQIQEDLLDVRERLGRYVRHEQAKAAAAEARRRKRRPRSVKGFA